MRITAAEAKHRVGDLRDELEAYRDQVEAMPFDIPSEDIPICLDHSIYRRKYTTELVEELDPRVKVLFAMIDNFAEKHGCHQELDFNAKLFSLKWSIADTAFKIGVLAGAILPDARRNKSIGSSAAWWFP